MGRLIDTDKLLNAFDLSENTRKHGGDGSGYDTRMLYEIQDTIEDAAEIDAIPVEWIERFLKNHEEGLPVYNIITRMLEAWREEQNEGI